MILYYRNKATQEIAYGERTKAAARVLPVELHGKARRWMAALDAARSLEGLRSPGLKLEKLVGNRKGQWGIRINDQYRICFYWEDANARDVEIVDYH